MNAQDLANNLWALEVLGCTGPAFRAVLETLCGAALRRLRTPKGAEAFIPQHLSIILLALEGLKLGDKPSELLAAAVAAEVVQRGFAGFNPQDLSNSAWALAKMGYGAGATSQATQQSQWYAAAAAAAQRPGVMAGAMPQNWANLLYALALVRHLPPPALLDAGAAAAMQRGKAQHCANTLWALAVLQLRHAGLEAAVCGRLGELLRLEPESLVAQGLCNSLWALAVLAGGGGPASPAAATLASALAREAVRRREEINGDNLRQLWQAQQELGGEVTAAFAHSHDLLAAMEAAVAAERATGSTTSSTQKQVAEALQRLLQKDLLPIVSVQTEAAVEGVLGRVDIVAGWSDGRRVAIEVDGPDHFLTNRKDDPSAVDGSTALRNRQLRRAFGEGGLLCVAYWEWYGLRMPSAQEACLLHQLQDLLSGASSGAAGSAAGNGSAATPRRSQQRTTPPQPYTAGRSSSATTSTSTSTTASSSQTRRVLVVRRTARKQEAAGSGGGAGEASDATAAVATVPAEAEEAAPARQQSAEKAQRLPISGSGGGAGEGGGDGAPLAPQPPPPQQQQQRVSAPRARRSSSHSQSRSSQAGSPPPPVEVPPPEQMQAASQPRRTAGGKRTERKAAAAPAADGGGGGGGGSGPGAVVVPAAVSENQVAVVAGEEGSTAADVEGGAGGGSGGGGGLPAGSRRRRAVGTGRRAASSSVPGASE